MKTILLILILAVSAFCSEKRISDYCTPDDGLDDSKCFQKAVDDIIVQGGGSIVFTAGEWNLNDTVSFITYSKINNSILIKGSKGAILRPNIQKGAMLVFGNQNQVILEDLVVLGNPAITVDVNSLIRADYVMQLRIDRCQFVGLMSETSLLSFSNVDTVIRDSAFYGNASRTAVIEAVNFGGLQISDTQFFDYGHFDGNYYSKTPYGNPAWIKLTTTSRVIPNATAQLPVSITNVRFDEGAVWGMDVSGVPYIELMGVMQNVSGIDGAGGIRLSGVKYAEVKMSMFGYSANPRPAIQAMNKTNLYIDSMTVGNGVFYGTRDATSQVSFNPRACADCSFDLASASKISLAAPRR